jgi:hypothetical protein
MSRDAELLADEAAEHLRRFVELVGQGYRLQPEFWNEYQARIQADALDPVLRGHERAPLEEFQGIVLGWLPVLYRGSSRPDPMATCERRRVRGSGTKSAWIQE